MSDNNTQIIFDLGSLISQATNGITNGGGGGNTSATGKTVTNDNLLTKPQLDAYTYNNTVRIDGSTPMYGTLKVRDIEMQEGTIQESTDQINESSERCFYFNNRNNIGTWRMKQRGIGNNSTLQLQVYSEDLELNNFTIETTTETINGHNILYFTISDNEKLNATNIHDNSGETFFYIQSDDDGNGNGNDNGNGNGNFSPISTESNITALRENVT